MRKESPVNGANEEIEEIVSKGVYHNEGVGVNEGIPNNGNGISRRRRHVPPPSRMCVKERKGTAAKGRGVLSRRTRAATVPTIDDRVWWRKGGVKLARRPRSRLSRNYGQAQRLARHGEGGTPATHCPMPMVARHPIAAAPVDGGKRDRCVVHGPMYVGMPVSRVAWSRCRCKCRCGTSTQTAVVQGEVGDGAKNRSCGR